MARKRERIVNLYVRPGNFAFFFRRISGNKEEYDFSELEDLRKVLNNEKAKILSIIKTKSPSSIYDLAKELKRDFKAVREDVKLLEKFGLIELRSIIKGKRRCLKPEIALDTLQININFD
ncbi:MAG: HTH domain-containing protein [Candidatus Pacearchaeota archaeon]